jgi:hypothetical protein
MENLINKKGILAKMVSGDTFSISELINKIQGFCLGLRLTHWTTVSFELHKAVESTQADLEELLDSFVETFIGMHGGNRPILEKTVTQELDEDSLITYLKDVSIKDTSLLNIRDEMLQVIYKFKYLKTLK